jgi:hypothetical protein
LHNVWINYAPLFQANVSDPDNDQTRAHFEILNYPYSPLISNYVNSGQTTSYGPLSILDGEWWWSARAQDITGLFSDFTGFWVLKKDTVKPLAQIDQENGESIDTLIWVKLLESDDRSGIAQGDVDVRINGGSWTDQGLPNNGNTIDDFIYTATPTTQQSTYTLPGTFTWTAPSGVTQVTAQVWAAGAGAAGSDNADAGPGGGGGAYAKKTINVTPGTNYTVFVGAGGTGGHPGLGTNPIDGQDSYFINTNTVLAKPGRAPTSMNGGQGGSASSSKGDIRYSGGNGGNGAQGDEWSAAGGAGGGSSAGTNSNGNNGGNGTYEGQGGLGGTAPLAGGAGANGGNLEQDGNSATQVGGGAGGAGGSLELHTKRPGGNGYEGKVVLTFTSSVIGSFYEFRYRTKDNANNWSDYAYDGSVTLITNNPPQTINLRADSSDPCSIPPYYMFKFTFSDPDNNTQSGFDFQVDNNSNFSSPEINRSFSNRSDPNPTENTQSVSLSTKPSEGYLNYNTIYYWRAKTYDQYGADSGWAIGPFITTFVHKSPFCDFSFIPNNPVPKEIIEFTNTSRCWDQDPINGASCSTQSGDSFDWDFDYTNKGGASPKTSNAENPTTKYSLPGLYTIKLQTTDSHGYTCSFAKQIRVSFPLPHYREVRP